MVTTLIILRLYYCRVFNLQYKAPDVMIWRYIKKNFIDFNWNWVELNQIRQSIQPKMCAKSNMWCGEPSGNKGPAESTFFFYTCYEIVVFYQWSQQKRAHLNSISTTSKSCSSYETESETATQIPTVLVHSLTSLSLHLSLLLKMKVISYKGKRWTVNLQKALTSYINLFNTYPFKSVGIVPS